MLNVESFWTTSPHHTSHQCSISMVTNISTSLFPLITTVCSKGRQWRRQRLEDETTRYWSSACNRFWDGDWKIYHLTLCRVWYKVLYPSKPFGLQYHKRPTSILVFMETLFIQSAMLDLERVAIERQALTKLILKAIISNISHFIATFSYHRSITYYITVIKEQGSENQFQEWIADFSILYSY